MIYSGAMRWRFLVCSRTGRHHISFHNLFPDLYKRILKKVEESYYQGGCACSDCDAIFAAEGHTVSFHTHNMMNWRVV